MNPPDEFYVWGPLTSKTPLDPYLWKNFEVAVKAGRWRWSERARCVHCHRLVGWCNASSNLRKHMARNHPDIPLHPPRVDDPIWSAIADHPRFEETVAGEIWRCAGDRETREGTCVFRCGGTFPRAANKWIWNYFMRSPTREVRCVLCGKDVAWRARGLEPLYRHFQGVHLSRGKRLILETLLDKRLLDKERLPSLFHL